MVLTARLPLIFNSARIDVLAGNHRVGTQHFFPAPGEEPVSQARVASQFEPSVQPSNQHICAFNNLPTTRLPLKYLKKVYERKTGWRAVQQLSQSLRVEIDDEFIEDTSNAEIHITKDALDFLLVVSAFPDLSAVLPATRQTAASRSFHLSMNQAQREFPHRGRGLGFDGAGIMRYIGRSPNNEAVFIAFPENSFFDKRAMSTPEAITTGLTCMSRPHARMAIAFLLYCLAGACIRGYRVSREASYKIDLHAKDGNYEAAFGTLWYVWYNFLNE